MRRPAAVGAAVSTSWRCRVSALWERSRAGAPSTRPRPGRSGRFVGHLRRGGRSSPRPGARRPRRAPIVDGPVAFTGPARPVSAARASTRRGRARRRTALAARPGPGPHVAAAGDAVRPVREPAGRVVGADDEPRPHAASTVRERALDLALAERLERAVVLADLLGAGLGERLDRRVFVHDLRERRVDGDARDEDVVADRGGEQARARADDARDVAGGVDDGVPLPAAEPVEPAVAVAASARARGRGRRRSFPG